MQYPNMRKELLEHLRSLSDFEYQKECWVEGNCPDGVVHDELDYAVHFLFDDTELSTNSESLIGVFLIDKNEAVLVHELCKKIQIVFEQHGTQLSDVECINCIEWKEVIQKAKVAYDALSRSC